MTPSDEFENDLEALMTKELTRQLAVAAKDDLALFTEGLGRNDKTEEKYADFLAKTFEKHFEQKALADIALLLVKHYLKKKVLDHDEFEYAAGSCWNGVWIDLKPGA